MNIPPEIKYLYYYHLGLSHPIRDQEVWNLIRRPEYEGYTAGPFVRAIIKRLKEDKSDEVG